VQRWQTRILGGSQIRNEALEDFERVPGRECYSGIIDGRNAFPGGERVLGIPSDERPPRPALATLNRLEQKAGIVTDQLLVGRYRSLAIGQHLLRHRDDSIVGGEFEKRRTIGVDGHDSGA
jgi:hypothetical protein